MESKYVKLRSATLHVILAGKPTSPALLFLHGFPSFWLSWQQQIDYFSAQHFYVIAPDGRGYNKSSKPKPVSDYKLSVLVKDMQELLIQLQVQQAFVVAHDWGGIVAWALLQQHPTLVKKAVIINAPYLPAYTKFSFQQLRKSWYVYFFQLPFLPEWMMRRNRFAMLKDVLVKTSLRGTFSNKELMKYEEAWAQPGSLTAMINWYRALARYSKDAKLFFRAKRKIETPVLMLWGMKDAFLEPEAGVCPADDCTHFFIKHYNDATHWLPLEKAAEVNADILQFISE